MMNIILDATTSNLEDIWVTDVDVADEFGMTITDFRGKFIVWLHHRHNWQWESKNVIVDQSVTHCYYKLSYKLYKHLCNVWVD